MQFKLKASEYLVPVLFEWVKIYCQMLAFFILRDTMNNVISCQSGSH